MLAILATSCRAAFKRSVNTMKYGGSQHDIILPDGGGALPSPRQRHIYTVDLHL